MIHSFIHLIDNRATEYLLLCITHIGKYLAKIYYNNLSYIQNEYTPSKQYKRIHKYTFNISQNYESFGE